jgi:hypothetical protein
MKKISLIYWLHAFCVVLFFAACAEEEYTAKHIINGTITDEAGSPITNVTVLLHSQSVNFSTKTDVTGKYKFENLELGLYNMSFSKEGFENETKEIEVIWGRNFEYDCSLKNLGGISVGGTATVTITDNLSISDGIYLWLDLSANTQKYYENFYDIDISSWSDIEIINSVIANGSDYTKNYNRLYYWDLRSNTNYTYCFVAIDEQGKAGRLEKKTIKTKSANSQPLAEISILNISDGTVYFNVIRSNYCSWFVLSIWYNLSTEDLNAPDILWAADLYEARINMDNVYNKDMIDYHWTPSNQGLCAIVTFGFFASNESSGVISKKVFNSITGVLHNASPITPSARKVKGLSSTER